MTDTRETPRPAPALLRNWPYCLGDSSVCLSVQCLSVQCLPVQCLSGARKHSMRGDSWVRLSICPVDSLAGVLTVRSLWIADESAMRGDLCDRTHGSSPHR